MPKTKSELIVAECCLDCAKASKDETLFVVAFWLVEIIIELVEMMEFVDMLE